MRHTCASEVIGSHATLTSKYNVSLPTVFHILVILAHGYSLFCVFFGLRGFHPLTPVAFLSYLHLIKPIKRTNHTRVHSS